MTLPLNLDLFDMSLVRADSGAANKSLLLFPHLVAAKRKRDSSFAIADITMDETDDRPAAKIRRIEPIQSQADTEEDEDPDMFNDCPAGSRTPAKRQIAAGGNVDAIAAAAWQELVSPNKRVQFNMKPMPPTPGRRVGTPRRSILKTPSKATPLKMGGSPRTGTTPRKSVGGLATPLRPSGDRKASVPARRSIIEVFLFCF